MTCKEGQFDVVELMVKNHFNGLGINLNVQHANGMTPFNLTVNVRLLDTPEKLHQFALKCPICSSLD